MHTSAVYRAAALRFCIALLFVAAGLMPLQSSSTAQADTEKAPVMLAHTWEPHIDIRGWWMSEKLDGIRGYWTGSQLISRSGEAFVTPPWFTRNFPSVPLDGELWSGRQTFSDISSIVRHQTPGDAWKTVRYMIFDAPQAKGGFESRLDFARQWFQHHPNPQVTIIEQERCQDEAHLRRKLADIEALGGEGLILRKPQSPYTVGRSHDLLKVKSFQDAEAVVIEHQPGTGKHAGRLGALLVELPNGVRFSIGTGFSDAERENPPPVGATITFKYQGYTNSGIPRFASYLRVRDKL